MRQLLMAVMLILTVLLLYGQFGEGEDGARARIRSSGEVMSGAISRIDP